jgi:hypothetical protein
VLYFSRKKFIHLRQLHQFLFAEAMKLKNIDFWDKNLTKKQDKFRLVLKDCKVYLLAMDDCGIKET